MARNKKDLTIGLTGPITDEERKQGDLAWKVLCEKGCVDVMDPLNTEVKSLKEERCEPGAVLADYHNAYGDPDYKEFVHRMLKEAEGESAKKR